MTSKASSFRQEAEQTGEQERAIQRKIDRTDEEQGEGKKKPEAMQAGARIYPSPPLQAQHLDKAGA